MRPDRDWIRAHMLALDKVLVATAPEARAAYFWTSTAWYWTAELEHPDIRYAARSMIAVATKYGISSLDDPAPVIALANRVRASMG